jgi:peroxiredoxin
VPGYIAKQDALKALGIDAVIIYCVNDAAVMHAWSVDQGVPEDGIIKLYGDPYSELTEALGMELEHSGPKSLGLINRCKRHALFVDDGVVKLIRVAEREDDPAGDDFPDDTLAEAMIEAIAALEKKDEL